MARRRKEMAKLFVVVTYKDGETNTFDADEMETFPSKERALGFTLVNFISPDSKRRVRRAFEVDEAANITEYRLVYKGGIMQFEREDAEEPPAEVKVEDDAFYPNRLIKEYES